MRYDFSRKKKISHIDLKNIFLVKNFLNIIKNII